MARSMRETEKFGTRPSWGPTSAVCSVAMAQGIEAELSGGIGAPPGGPDPEAVRAIVERLSSQFDVITRRMIARYREEIVDYRLAAEEVVDQDVYSVSLGLLGVTVANLASGRRPSPEELEETRAGAARRVHQNVSLETFLHALRLWGQTLWQTVLECADERVEAEREAALHLAGQLLEHLDLQSVVAAQGYLDELQSVWSDREVVRRDLLDALIAGDGDSERVRRLARSLRLRLRDDYIVIIVRGEERPLEESPEQSLPARVALRRITEAVRARLKPTAGSLLVGMRHGEVIALYPFEETAELETIQRACDELACDLEGHEGRVGVSGAHRGLAQLALSCAEAGEAVEIAAQTGVRGRAVAFDDVLIDSIVRSSRHAERVVDSTIAPLLAYDAGRQAELVPTLRAFIRSGFNLAKSAECLSVHPNTVVYRLGRIREISGRDPHSPDDLL